MSFDIGEKILDIDFLHTQISSRNTFKKIRGPDGLASWKYKDQKNLATVTYSSARQYL